MNELPRSAGHHCAHGPQYWIVHINIRSEGRAHFKCSCHSKIKIKKERKSKKHSQAWFRGPRCSALPRPRQASTGPHGRRCWRLCSLWQFKERRLQFCPLSWPPRLPLALARPEWWPLGQLCRKTPDGLLRPISQQAACSSVLPQTWGWGQGCPGNGIVQGAGRGGVVPEPHRGIVMAI